MQHDEVLFKDTALGPFAGTLMVADAGYEWIEGLQPEASGPAACGDAGPWLVAPGSMGESFPATRKLAFANRNLHRTFASVRPTQDRIDKFAARYGLLGLGCPLFDPTIAVQPLRYGESFQAWRREITKMAGLVRLWDAVQREDRDTLRPFVTWQAEPRQVVVSFAWSASRLWPEVAKEHRLAQSRAENISLLREAVAKDRDGYVEIQVDRLASDLLGIASSEFLDRWEFGDTIEPVRYYIYREVNRVLDGRVKPAVLPYRANDLYFFTDSLLAALYALFALELTGKVRPAIICAGCGTYFIPDHGGQEYCEERCRKLRWYRDNRRPRGKVNGQAR